MIASKEPFDEFVSLISSFLFLFGCSILQNNPICQYQRISGMPIQSELHKVDVISAEKINDILDETDFITEKDRRLLQDVSIHVGKEPVWKMKHCELIVAFHNITGGVNHRVKQIVITAGEPEHIINCSLDSDETFHWNCLEKFTGADVPTESYRCKIITRYEINKILHKSLFLERPSYRKFFASEVRTAVDKEFRQVLQNCTLTVDLEEPDCANCRTKIIKITAGEGENAVHSSRGNPWHVSERTDGVVLLHGLRWFYNNTFGRILRLGGRVMDILETAVLNRVENVVGP